MRERLYSQYRLHLHHAGTEQYACQGRQNSLWPRFGDHEAIDIEFAFKGVKLELDATTHTRARVTGALALGADHNVARVTPLKAQGCACAVA
jgi:hypothetical protein